MRAPKALSAIGLMAIVCLLNKILGKFLYSLVILFHMLLKFPAAEGFVPCRTNDHTLVRSAGGTLRIVLAFFQVRIL